MLVCSSHGSRTQGYLLYNFFAILVLFVNGPEGSIACLQAYQQGGEQRWLDKVCVVAEPRHSLWGTGHLIGFCVCLQHCCPTSYWCFRTPQAYFQLLRLMVAQLMVVKPLANICVLIYGEAIRQKVRGGRPALIGNTGGGGKHS